MDVDEEGCCCLMMLVVMQARSGKGFGGLQDQKGDLVGLSGEESGRQVMMTRARRSSGVGRRSRAVSL